MIDVITTPVLEGTRHGFLGGAAAFRWD